MFEIEVLILGADVIFEVLVVVTGSIDVEEGKGVVVSGFVTPFHQSKNERP